MDKAILSNHAKNFWKWFEEHVELIEEVLQSTGHPKTEFIIQQLNQYILVMGNFKWDIKHPNENSFHFILSPNNNRELLNRSQRIIEEAPQLSKWSFFSAQPPTGELTVSLYDNEMDVQLVDAQNWNAILLPSSNNRFELIIEADTSWELDEDIQLIAVDLLLNQLIGEELKIKAFNGLEIVKRYDFNQNEEFFKLKDLLFFLKNK